jgi:hypothetical protein
MRNVLRLAVIATLVLGAAAVRADDDAYAGSAPRTRTDSSSEATTEAPTATPKAVVERGAASMEPGEGIDEDPGTGAHQEWVESIWESP